MKKVSIPNGFGFRHIEEVEGETIEQKVRRIVDNNEPISDGAPLIYTERDKGVIAGYNVRTDKWDIALMAMDAVAKANIAKGKNPPKTEDKNIESTGATGSSSGEASTTDA